MLNNVNGIKVWDLFVRIFHWTLVAAFFIAYFTEEDFLSVHSFAGYTVLVLILLRIFWGMVGSRYARFSDFIYSPKTIKGFIKDTLSLKAKRYLGHNPAGGAMIFLLLIALLLTTITGIALYGAEEQLGPMAGWFGSIPGYWGEVFEDIHEFFANFTLLLVFVHVSGVIIESLIHKENLVKAMFTGMKSPETDTHKSGVFQ